jgi:Tol biopolymer transport system component/serine/threonine protein kinase
MVPQTRWERLKELLETAVAMAPDRRAAFIDGECGGDPALRQELESLVGAHEEAGEFLAGSAFDPPPISPAAPVEPLVGRRLGPYRVLGLIGRGGMGAVYEAVRDDDEFEKRVAIKVSRHELFGEAALLRFRAERQILAGLEHPGIARLLDGGTTEDGRPFFVMEHVAGTRIDAWAEQRRLDLRARLVLFQSVCAIVQYAHRERVVHRDLKPANILVTAEGAPKLLDFGIAKLLDPAGSGDTTATAMAPMTPEYASPEQLQGRPSGIASDVYSLGIILYELLTGQRPHRLAGRGPVELAHILLHEEPTRPSAVVTEATARSAGVTLPRLRAALGGDIDTIVLKALRKDPARRYASVEALADDVGRHLAGLPVRARPDTWTYRARKFAGRHRATVAWTVGVASLAGALVALLDRSAAGRATARTAAGERYRVVPFTSAAGRERNPAFSPDGQRLAYEWTTDQRLGDIYVRAIDGGEPLRLTDHADAESCPAFSRDGRQVAFLRFNRAGADVVVKPPGGGEERAVARLRHGDGNGLDWLPDGRIVVVDAGPPGDRGMFAVPPAGGPRHRITAPADGETQTCPRVSPDGRALAFLSQRRPMARNLMVVPLDRPGAPRALTGDEWQPADLAWMPDGKALVFSSARGGHDGLWRVALAGGAPEPLRLAAGLGRSSLAIALRGDRLAYTVTSDDSNLWEVGTGPGAGPPVRRIASTRGDSHPSYSPDGRRIAFRSDRSGTAEIWLADADGANAQQVTDFRGGHAGSPSWSSDGRLLAFDAYPDGSGDIYVLDLAGGPPRAVLAGPTNDVVPSWSRDGAWIYFGSDRDGAWRLWKMPADGGPATPVTGPGGFAAVESGDGRFLYFANRIHGGLWRMPLGGGPETRVDSSPVRWGTWALAPDGLYLATGEGHPARYSIDFVHLESGRRRRVAELERPLDIWAGALSLSPDGQRLLFTQYDRREADIMLVENFR